MDAEFALQVVHEYLPLVLFATTYAVIFVLGLFELKRRRAEGFPSAKVIGFAGLGILTSSMSSYFEAYLPTGLHSLPKEVGAAILIAATVFTLFEWRSMRRFEGKPPVSAADLCGDGVVRGDVHCLYGYG